MVIPRIQGKKLLRITAPHFVAGCEWMKVNGVWWCWRTAPIIQYLQGKNADEVSGFLRAKGWAYEWVKPAGSDGPESPSRTSPSPQSGP